MTEDNFVDYVKIHVSSGKGGSGSTHLRREKYVAKGGPDGGDGGRGGNIVFVSDKNLWTLYHFKFKKHFKAEQGHNGSKSRSSGANGKDEIIKIPVGTVVKDLESGEILFEPISDNEEKVVVPGGKGGLGNWHFKSSTNQTPKYAQPGLEGHEKQLLLELKVLADVGLVGFPNAGKSTLLSVITDAKPKIANYEFTTLKPNLGIVRHRDFKSFVVSDIPGIIEGASEGKGLGHHFLRHIERNSTLLFLISCESRNVIKEYQTLLNELKNFNRELLNKERIVVISKSDLINQKERLAIKNKLKTNLQKIESHFISAVTLEGIVELKDLIWNKLNS
ncbi:MAG: GTPase ObgE [Flavobacteriaceae bacterium]|nr:MAG: GTPase ObgE [Flavobacteriales bacterium]|tara:strand:+ start:4285 stop:5286 length:1002 start_codon:yes stop_codon:yes gene_type:complete